MVDLWVSLSHYQSEAEARRSFGSYRRWKGTRLGSGFVRMKPLFMKWYRSESCGAWVRCL